MVILNVIVHVALVVAVGKAFSNIITLYPLDTIEIIFMFVFCVIVYNRGAKMFDKSLPLLVKQVSDVLI